ncbi:MAG TPA: VWA domain-containing protein [Pyrinomonadaceae bacterium]|nr:VWA domain-containing protein [Pyrinomonadaceae bacterium]
MRLTTFIFSLLVIAASASAVASQSLKTGRGEKQIDRPAMPVPTPPVSASSASDDGDVIKVATQLVSIPVRVMDKKGRFIAGLKQDDFRVTENGVDQEISYFSTEEEPFTVVLMLDMSYSTTFKINEIQNAAIAFIDQLRPVDKVAVVSFDADIHVLTTPTSDRREIYRAIRSTKINTGTSLYEAVDRVMNTLTRSVKGRKAIILFSDGVDTTSRLATSNGNLADAMELDALIYPIRYDTFADVQSMKNSSQTQRPVIVPPLGEAVIPPNSAVILSSIKESIVRPAKTDESGTSAEDYARAASYMVGLADRTGGRIYEATSLTNLAEAYSRIASELREFYSIGYYPKTDREAGQQANIKVKVMRDGLAVRSRETIIKRTKK